MNLTPEHAAVRRNPSCGPVDGRIENGVARFLGLPFAKPPIGRLRFQAPQKPDAWTTPRPAIAYGPTAPQPDREATLIPEPEEAGDDYLNLNVFAPADLPDTPLPVLVYIHGGGYFSGCNRSPWFEGDRFVDKGIILVTPSYRLNVEGFMPVDGAPDNRALLDWVAALEWVRDNIAAFGGDPSAVTLSGQSAGAGAVATLLATPAAEGLFHRAILFSGSIGFGGSKARANAFADRFSAAVGRPCTVDALTDLSRRALITGYEQAVTDPTATGPGAPFLRNIRHGIPLQPLAGTASLPLPPAIAMQRGAGKDIPVLLTTTRDEFVFAFDVTGNTVRDAQLADGLSTLEIDAGGRHALAALYPGYPPARLLGQAATDTLMRAPMIRMAALRKGIGAAPTWTAEFRRQSPVTLDAPLRAAHCLDMPFYFDCLDLPSAKRVTGPKPPQALADTMHEAIAAFVRCGDPGWSPWNQSGRTRIWNSPEAGESTDLNDVYGYAPYHPAS